MSEKGKGVIAYLLGWLGGLIILYGVKETTRDTRFHAALSIVISLAYIFISVIYGFSPLTIPFFSTLLYILYALGIIFGIVRVVKEQDPELPVVGPIAKNIFGKKIEEEKGE